MKQLGLDVPKFYWKEKYFVECDHESSQNSVVVKVRGQSPIDPPIFIDNVILFSKEKPIDNLTKESNGDFSLSCPLEIIDITDLLVQVNFKSFLNLDPAKIKLAIIQGKKSIFSQDFCFETDPFKPSMVPPKRENVVGPGALLSAIKKFPGKEFLHSTE